MEYYIYLNNQQQGPFDESELLQRGVTPSTLVWCENMDNWLPADQVQALNYLFAPPQPPMQQPPVFQDVEQTHQQATATQQEETTTAGGNMLQQPTMQQPPVFQDAEQTHQQATATQQEETTTAGGNMLQQPTMQQPPVFQDAEQTHQQATATQQEETTTAGGNMLQQPTMQQPAQQPQTSSVVEPKKSKSSTIIIVGCIIVTLLVAAGIATSFLLSKKDKATSTTNAEAPTKVEGNGSRKTIDISESMQQEETDDNDTDHYYTLPVFPNNSYIEDDFFAQIASGNFANTWEGMKIEDLGEVRNIATERDEHNNKILIVNDSGYRYEFLFHANRLTNVIMSYECDNPRDARANLEDKLKAANFSQVKEHIYKVNDNMFSCDYDARRVSVNYHYPYPAKPKPRTR